MGRTDSRSQSVKLMSQNVKKEKTKGLTISLTSTGGSAAVGSKGAGLLATFDAEPLTTPLSPMGPTNGDPVDTGVPPAER